MPMRQLDLFGDPAPAAPVPAPAAEAPAEVDPFLIALPSVLPGQIGLFDDRNLRLGRARAAIAEGRLQDAHRDFQDVRARYPGDTLVVREATRAEDLLGRLAKIDAPRARKRGAALLTLVRELEGAPEPWASLRRRLLVGVAEEIRRTAGDAGELEGQPPGHYLLEAGALAEARASFAAAVASQRSAKLLFRLADATTALGDTSAARRHYLEALLLNPFDGGLLSARDEAVRSLPGVARFELEIDEEPIAWAAPVGILTGVLPRSINEDGALMTPREEDDSSHSPARREALTRARGFVAALAEVGAAHARGGEALIEARRALKRISALLFAVYMERVVRGRPG